MYDKLRAMLTEDETLLWSCRPASFDTMDRTNRKGIIVGFILKAIFAAGATMMYLRVARNTDAGIKPGVIAIILLIAAFAFAYPFLTARRLRQNTYYGLTDRRILRVDTKEESVPYNRIEDTALRSDEDGHFTLLCGPRALGLKPDRWRSEATLPFIDDPDRPETQTLVLYALPVDDKLRGILKQYLA